MDMENTAFAGGLALPAPRVSVPVQLGVAEVSGHSFSDEILAIPFSLYDQELEASVESLSQSTESENPEWTDSTDQEVSGSHSVVASASDKYLTGDNLIKEFAPVADQEIENYLGEITHTSLAEAELTEETGKSEIFVSSYLGVSVQTVISAAAEVAVTSRIPKGKTRVDIEVSATGTNGRFISNTASEAQLDPDNFQIKADRPKEVVVQSPFSRTHLAAMSAALVDPNAHRLSRVDADSGPKLRVGNEQFLPRSSPRSGDMSLVPSVSAPDAIPRLRPSPEELLATQNPNQSLVGSIEKIPSRALIELPSGVQPTLQNNSAAAGEQARVIAAQLTAAVVTDKSGQIEIRLNPEELGRVRMTMSGTETSMVVTIIAERAETQELMRRQIEQLAQEFRSIGYGNTTFQFGDGTQQFSAQDDTNNIGLSEADQDTDGVQLVTLSAQNDGLDIRL